MKWQKKVTIDKNDGYYMPLFNVKGMKSSITPYLAGDVKIDQHHYALEPTTEVDLYHPTFSRNVIFLIDNVPYFLNGQTERQQQDKIEVEMGFLYQTVKRQHPLYTMDTTSFVAQDDNVELHHITFTNSSDKAYKLGVVTAIPIYGRSADNLRDHRHVTSLLHQIFTVEGGVLVKPTLSFDERGHQVNQTVYSVYAKSDQLNIKGYIPTLDDFIDGGSLLFPRGLSNLHKKNEQVNGYEAMGAIAFDDIILNPGTSIDLYVSIGIHDQLQESLKSAEILSGKYIEDQLNKTKEFFMNYVSGLQFNFYSEDMKQLMPWVVLQPMLRRYFGNSYLPHHDYGHGGRGWRDLWQDLLSLIMMNDDSVKDLLFNNFQGIRIDGSNATIIGDRPGEFKADRNMITRVWSDHGAWPLLTVKMYIDETGDLEFLLKKQYYFKDQFTHYTKKTRLHQGINIQFDENDEPYEGSILEHLLLQNLVGYHNIGAHGFTRLEDADWNDGLDMATKQGETIAFTHMYASNLLIIAYLVDHLQEYNLEIFDALHILLNQDANIQTYFDEVANFSGKKVIITREELIARLTELAESKIAFLREHAYKGNAYQSYFDNQSKDIDDESTLSLTGQAMALLSMTATQEQAIEIAKTTEKMLFDPSIGGMKLNSNYHHILPQMGRAYGFAYGHKENGAVFSHMVLMYVYGLYQYGCVNEGKKVYQTLLNQAINPASKVPLGIPEYFSEKGIGKYMFLTGSASWLLKLLRTEVFGISMRLGALYVTPKLSKSDFIDGKASIITYINQEKITVTYHNPKSLDFGEYHIEKIQMNHQEVTQGIKSIQGNIEVYLNEKC